VTSPPPVITLSQLLVTLALEQVNAEFFVGNQIDEIGHHISGGHIAAQALMAASRTVPDRLPHSMHMYFLRAGDARHPVDFEVTALHDGGTFSARRVTARQFGSVLLEGIASFSRSVESAVYQQLPPDLPDPESVPTFAEQGYKDLVFSEWFGFFAPGGTPAPVVQKINTALRAALAQKDVADGLAVMGLEATSSTPQELAKLLKESYDRWGPIVKKIGFTADS